MAILWRAAGHCAVGVLEIGSVKVGQDFVKPRGNSSRRLDKLRFFNTYARWNCATQRSAPSGHPLSSLGRFGGDRQGSTFGVQWETWF